MSETGKGRWLVGGFGEVERMLADLIASERTDVEADAKLREARRLVIEAAESAVQRDRVDRDVPPPPPPQGPPVRRRVIAPGDDADGVHVNWDGKTPVFELRDATVLGGYRSCLIGLQGTVHRTELRLERVAFRSAEPNGAPDWDGVGTYWGARLQGIRSGLIQDVDVRDLFGRGSHFTSLEGHGFYTTLSPQRGSVLTYKRCRFRNLGGHAIYHTSAAQPWRADNAPKPEDGGLVVIEDVVIEDTDLSEARGAYAISLTDAYARHELRRVMLDHSAEYLKNASNLQGFHSRGLLMAERLMPGGLLVENCSFRAMQPSDRGAEVWIEGPEVVELVNSRFECAAISVNDPWGDLVEPGPLTKTKVLRVRGCMGDAVLKWKGQELGRIGEVEGEWKL